MQKVRIDIEELEAAIKELKIRSKNDFVDIEISDRNIHISTVDSNSNTMEAILNSNKNMAAQFRYTERLMYMKSKKRL